MSGGKTISPVTLGLDEPWDSGPWDSGPGLWGERQGKLSYDYGGSLPPPQAVLVFEVSKAKKDFCL